MEGSDTKTHRILEAIGETFDEPLYCIDSDLRILWANQAVLGARNETDPSGQTCHFFRFGRETPCPHCAVRQTLDSGNSTAWEFSCDAGKTWSVTCRAVSTDDHTSASAVVMTRDVSQAKRTAVALREAEERFQRTAENSPSMIFINQDGRVVYANAKAEEVLGYTREELCAADFDYRSLITPDTQERVAAAHARHLAGEEVPQYEYAVLTRDGTRIEVVNATRLISYAGKPAILGVVTDVSDLVRTRKRLEDVEKLHRTVMETSPDSIVMVDLEGKFLMANKEAARQQGYQSVTDLLAANRTSFDAVVPEDREKAMATMQAVLRDGRATSFQFRIRGPEGQTAVRESSASLVRDEHGKPKAIVAVTRDITDRKRAEESRLHLERQLLHAQKLESLGVLAGGIAHDFNNLLTGVLGNASLALHGIEPDNPLHQKLRRIEAAAERAVQLTGQMLAYAGKSAATFGLVHIPTLVAEISDLLQASIPKKVTVDAQLDDQATWVEGDAAQLQQVVMNLITNAAESMGDNPGRISIRVLSCDADYCRTSPTPEQPDLPMGKYVCIEVRDTGCGMDESVRSRIFDPFFTTKFQGRGLGLAATLGIARSHGGAIRVDSKPGKGTTMHFVLPAAEGREIEKKEPRATDRNGTGMVLVIDDEETVREVASEMLEEMGFGVITATNGREGLAQYERYREAVTVVLLDLTMPEIDGEEVFRRLRKMRHDLPIVISSGCAEQEVATRFEGQGVTAFVKKPYGLQQLAETLTSAHQAAGDGRHEPGRSHCDPGS